VVITGKERVPSRGEYSVERESTEPGREPDKSLANTGSTARDWCLELGRECPIGENVRDGGEAKPIGDDTLLSHFEASTTQMRNPYWLA
jgi:hypothetical protein